MSNIGLNSCQYPFVCVCVDLSCNTDMHRRFVWAATVSTEFMLYFLYLRPICFFMYSMLPKKSKAQMFLFHSEPERTKSMLSVKVISFMTNIFGYFSIKV